MLRRSRKAFVVVVVMTLAALAAGVPAFAQNADELPEVLKGDGVTLYKTYQPPDQSYQILYDSTWKVIPGQAVGMAVRFVNEKDAKPGRTTELMQLVIAPAKGKSLAQMAAGMKAALAAKPGYTVVSDDALTIKGDQIQERNVHRFVFDTKNQDRTPVRGLEFMIVQDDFAYVITYLMPPEKFKETEGAAIQRVGLFKVTGKPQMAAANGAAKPADPTAPVPAAKEPPADAAPAAGGEWVKWESPDKAFSLSYPKGWEIQDAGAAEAVVAFVDVAGSAPGVLAGSAAVLKIPTGGNVNFTAGSADFNGWVKGLRNGLAGTAPDFKLLDEKTGTVAGIPAVRFMYEMKESDSPKVRCIQWIVARGAVAYAITFHVDPSRYDKFLPTERAITESFALAGQTKPAVAKPASKIALRPTLFESKEHGFKFTYQPGWGEAPVKADAVVLALGKQASAGKQAQTLMILSDKLEPNEKVSLKEMEIRLTEMSRAGIKDAKVIEATDLKLGGAEPARRLLISGVRALDDHEVRCLLVFALHGRDTVGFLGSAPVEDLESFKADFDKTVESFAFTATAPAAAAAAATAQPATPKPAGGAPVAFESAEHGMRLAQPGGWTARKTPDPATLLFLLPEAMKGPPRSIQVTVDPIEAGQPKPTLKDQADTALAALKAFAIPDAKILESADLKVGVEKARRIVIGGHNPKDKTEMRAVCVLFQHAGESVTISGRSALPEFDSVKEAVDAMAASAELTNATKKLK